MTRLLVDCIIKRKDKEELYAETLYVKSNKAALNPNPLAYQNQWMQIYFAERIPEPVLLGLLKLRNTVPPEHFEEAATLFLRGPDDNSMSNIVFESNIAAELSAEEIAKFPVTVRHYKSYLQSLHASFLTHFLELTAAHIARGPLPGPFAFVLGVMHDTGVGVAEDHAKALELYRIGKKDYNPYCLYTLFDIYTRSYATYGVKQDVDKGLRQMVKFLIYYVNESGSWITKSLLGVSKLQLLGLAYQHLDIYESSCQYVKKLLADERSDSLAVCKKALLQHIIAIDRKDIISAKKKLKELAKALAPHPLLLLKLADYYLTGFGGFHKKQSKAKELLMQVLRYKEENMVSMCAHDLLGFIYERVRQFKEAMQYIVKSSAYGLFNSMNMMAIGYTTAMGLETNLERGLKCLETSLVMGDLSAVFRLVELSSQVKEWRGKGQGWLALIQKFQPSWKDEAQADCDLLKTRILEQTATGPEEIAKVMFLYTSLLSSTQSLARYRLGKLYDKQHYSLEAQACYKECYLSLTKGEVYQEQIHVSSYYRLAKLYLTGKGCIKSVVKAIENFRLASKIYCCHSTSCLLHAHKAATRLLKLTSTT